MVKISYIMMIIRLRKYVNYKIYTDDTIKMIKEDNVSNQAKKKRILPEMQFLWYYSNSNNFISLSYSYFFQRNQLLKLILIHMRI